MTPHPSSNVQPGTAEHHQPHLPALQQVVGCRVTAGDSHHPHSLFSPSAPGMGLRAQRWSRCRGRWAAQQPLCAETLEAKAVSGAVTSQDCQPLRGTPRSEPTTVHPNIQGTGRNTDVIPNTPRNLQNPSVGLDPLLGYTKP